MLMGLPGEGWEPHFVRWGPVNTGWAVNFDLGGLNTADGDRGKREGSSLRT